MGRKRKNLADNILPLRVYRGKKQYEFHPVGGGSISLCSLDSPLSLVWSEYEKINNETKKKYDLSSLIADFFLSADFLNLGRESHKDYKKYASKLIPVFGEMLPDTIKPQQIRIYTRDQ